MKKHRLTSFVRICGFILGGLAALAAAAALYAWVAFDATRTGAELVSYFKDKQQRTLLLGEAPRLVMWPRPALRLTRASLSEAGSDETFASAERVRIDLEPLALLKGTLEIRALRFEALSLRLRQNAQGDWNAASLLSLPSSLSAATSWHWNPVRVVIENGRAAIEPVARSAPYLLSKLELDAGFAPGSDPGQLHVAAHLSDRRDASELDLRGTARLRLQDGLGAGRLEALELRADGNTHGLRGSTQHLAADALAWQANGQQGQINELTLRLRGAYREQAVDLQGSAAELAWHGFALKGHEAEARLDLRTVATHEVFGLQLPSLQAVTDSGFETPQARFTWQSERERAPRASVDLSGQLEARLRAGALQASAVQGELRLNHPRLRETPTLGKLSGRFDWSAAQARIDAQLALPQGELALEASLQDLWPLAGNFTLSARTLDLDALLQAGASALPWPQASGLALDGQLRLAGLKLGGLQIDRLSGPLSLRGARFSSPRLVLRGEGAELDASLNGDAATRHIRSEGSFRALPVERLAQAGAWHLPLQGRADGTYKLEGDGRDGQPFAQRVAGQIDWQIAQASLKGLDFAKGLGELAPAIQAGRMSARSASAGERSELGSASGRFEFAAGTLQAPRFQSRNAWLKLQGSGRAALAQDDIDFHLGAELSSAAPRGLAALGRKSLPLRIKGAAQAPDLRFEPAAAPSGRKP